MSAITAHIIETMPAPVVAAGSVALVCAAAGFVGWLALQHHVVKYGRLRFDRIVRASAVLAALVIGAAALPGSAGSQDRAIPVGLPDLISDPPFIWANKTVPRSDGGAILALAFDGYLHNIGDGVLELYGNPQKPDGVRQRWWDGEAWVEVASPPVLYETTDGHNHFHLMAAAEYELWNDGQTEKVGDASKVGFCLLDSIQRDSRFDDFYDINTYNYCEANNPDAELLRMGITPGWTDLYDANTTLQWVDVSDVTPGWYWVGSIMDPDDEIVESDETNNGLVFSENKFAVPGAVARPMLRQQAGEPIHLQASLVGTVGDVAWKVTEPPEHGFLDVPTGVDVFDPVVTYWPDPGFDGIDRFSVVAHDVASAFPLTPTQVTIEVDASEVPQATTAPVDLSEPEHVVAAPEISLTEWTRFELSAADLVGELLVSSEASRPVLDGAQWFSRDLAPGLSVDAISGNISGTPTLAPSGVATIFAVTETATIAIELPWRTLRPSQDGRSLDDLNDFSTSYGANNPRQIGKRVDDAVYSAQGLPPGTQISSNVPRIGGAPTEVGEFLVDVTATVDGEVVDSTSFTWTVRPAAIPAFPL